MILHLRLNIALGLFFSPSSECFIFPIGKLSNITLRNGCAKGVGPPNLYSSLLATIYFTNFTIYRVVFFNWAYLDNISDHPWFFSVLELYSLCSTLRRFFIMGRPVWDFNFFWNQLLMGQDLANSREAQLKKNTLYLTIIWKSCVCRRQEALGCLSAAAFLFCRFSSESWNMAACTGERRGNLSGFWPVALVL